MSIRKKPRPNSKPPFFTFSAYLFYYLLSFYLIGTFFFFWFLFLFHDILTVIHFMYTLYCIYTLLLFDAWLCAECSFNHLSCSYVMLILLVLKIGFSGNNISNISIRYTSCPFEVVTHYSR